MQQTDKRKSITVVLILYLIISVLFGLSAFKYLAPKFITPHTEIGIFALLSIAVALYVVFNLKKVAVKHVYSTSDTKQDSIAERDRKEHEQQELEQQEKELKRRKLEQDRQELNAKITEIYELTKDVTETEKYFDQLLISISKVVPMVQGVAYTARPGDPDPSYAIQSTYAFYTTDTSRSFALGEGIPGRVAKDKKILCLDQVPEGYITVVSGLGSSSPHYLIVAPIIHDGKTLAVLEMAMFEKPTFDINEFHKQFTEKLSDKISTLVKI